MKRLAEFRLHFEEVVSHQERELTNQLARQLTNLNLRRLQMQPNQKSGNENQPKSNREVYLYVCITGSPPLENEYEGIGIPGEKLMVYPQCYQPGSTEEDSKSRLQFVNLEKQAELLHNRLKNRTDKPLVFINHSFGSAIMSVLFRLYHREYLDRVIGIIGIGAYPIRIDRNFSEFIQKTEAMSKQCMIQHVDDLYEQHKNFIKDTGIKPNWNKYANIGTWMAFGHGIGFSEMFSYNRRWFSVLKCFIYGRQDNRLSESLLNQTAIYYAHKRKFDQHYQSKVKKLLENKYGMKVDNVQERFIYNIDGGKHSIHTQKNFKQLISNIINEYLSVLEEIVPL